MERTDCELSGGAPREGASETRGPRPVTEPKRHPTGKITLILLCLCLSDQKVQPISLFVFFSFLPLLHPPSIPVGPFRK